MKIIRKSDIDPCQQNCVYLTYLAINADLSSQIEINER